MKNKRTGLKLQMSELERPSVEVFRDRAKLPVVVVLDNIRSLHNIGSVFRTADAFNVERVVLCGITACPPHREIHKTALGATESVEWGYEQDCVEALIHLKQQGYTVVGVEQVHGSIMLDRFSEHFSGVKLAFVFGNEVKGVQQRVLDICDAHLEIPQWGTKHSLNVSVSVGVVLWETVRHMTP